MRESVLTTATMRWLDELATAGVFTTDAGLTIQSWNQWLFRATGLEPAAMIGQSLFATFPDIVARGLDRYYTAAIRGEVSVLSHRFHDHLLRIPTTIGDMPQTVRIAPLIDGDAIIGTITAIEDVGERVHSEAELRRQIAAAEQARLVAEEALRVKDEFLATLSHELRTPLNAVLGWTNILLGQPVEPEMLDRALKVIDRNATAQARLIDDMLDMARIVSGKLRLEIGLVDLVAATLAAVDVVAPAAHAKSLTIRKKLDGSPRLIMADADRIQQIVWNVLSNAVKFTPPGGTIDICINDTPETIELRVADTGKGIPVEFLPHVFERFRQANSSVSRTEGGLGLGLALVRQLVEMHGGHVAVASEGVGRGTTFTISFPVAQEEVVAATTHETVDAGALEAYRVLIVDDDPDWRDLLQTMFAAHGALATSVAGVSEAMAVITANAADRPDVLVADIGLPGEDGYALIERVRKLPSAVARMPAVAVTAYSGGGNRQRALEAGFDVYRSKPIAPDAVASAVVEALKRRRTPRRLRRA
jgi:two-component system, chemotaxis family, CheB/CheR fusion protein